MALDNYDPLTSRSAYVPSGAVNASRLAAHWTVDKYVHDMAAIGIISFFEGEANDPTTLTGYSSSKLWLRTPAGVTDEAGSVLIWDTVNSESLASSWVPLTPQRFSELIAETYILGGPLGALSIGAFPATRTILKALDTTVKKAAYLTESGREGIFVWRTGDYSAHIAADTLEGRYVKADAIASTAGAWERVDTRLNVKHFGAPNNGISSDKAAIQGALNVAAVASAPKHVYVPGSPYRYRILGDDTALRAYSDIVFEGDGMFATIFERDDFTNNSGGRRDFLTLDASAAGANMEFRNFQVLGEWEKAYTPAGFPAVTVNYRIPGNIQLEGTPPSSTGSTTTIILPNTASAIDDYYKGCGIQIGAGVGVGSDTTITSYVGSTRTATLQNAVTGGAPANATSYLQIGGYADDPAIGGRDDVSVGDTVANLATGFGFNLDDTGDLLFDGVMMRGIRNQAISIDNARSVKVHNCQLYKCARGGVSIRNSGNVVVTHNVLRFIGDDAIFNSQTGAANAPGDSQHTVIANNVLVDTVGMRFLGGHQLSITDNLLVRCMIKGIAVGPIDDNLSRNMFGLNISGNVILDMLDRNAIVYNNPSSAGEKPAAIEVFVGQGADPFILSGQNNGSGGVNKPETALWAVATRIPGTDITIRDNTIASYLKVGANVSDYNAHLDDQGNGGAFYHRGTLNTDGFVDPTLTQDHVSMYGIKFNGPLHSCDISGNKISCRTDYAGIYFGGNDTDGDTGLNADIQFDYAITKVRVFGNHISRVTAAVEIESDGLTTKQFDLAIEDNDIDADPYFEDALRVVSPNIDGTWQTVNHWAIDNELTHGLTIRNNRFANTPTAVRLETKNFIDGNIIYARAAATGTSSSNAGVRNIPRSSGAYIVIDRDSNPLSATYLKTDAEILTQSQTIPSTGRYVEGHFVRHSDPSIDSDGSYIAGWLRLTTGTGHTLGTDWVEERVYSRGQTASGTIPFVNITVAGTKWTEGSDQLRYKWWRRGNVIQGWCRLEFSDTTTGPPSVTRTQVNFSDMGLPDPEDPTGVGSGADEYVLPVAEFVAQAVAGTTNSSRGFIMKMADNSYRLTCDTSAAAWAIVAWNFTYVTDA